MQEIINNIKSIITDKGLKYKSVAAKSGIDTARFYRIMQGTSYISCEEIANICQALHITPNDVYGIKTT